MNRFLGVDLQEGVLDVGVNRYVVFFHVENGGSELEFPISVHTTHDDRFFFDDGYEISVSREYIEGSA